MTSSVERGSVRGDGQEAESGPSAPHPSPIPGPQRYSPQELLQAAQEGEMGEKLRCCGGSQSQERLGCEQEMQVGEGVDRHPVHGQGWGLQGRVWEGPLTALCPPPQFRRDVEA